MEQILINLVAGALGGVGVGKSSPTFDLGMIGNIISGLIGGGVLGQIVTLLLPAITAAAQSGNLSVEGIISQVIAGGFRLTCLRAPEMASRHRALPTRECATGTCAACYGRSARVCFQLVTNWKRATGSCCSLIFAQSQRLLV